MRSDDVTGGFADYRKAVADEVLARAQLERARDLYRHGAISTNNRQLAENVATKECGVAPWPLRGRAEVLLADAAGVMAPTFGSPEVTQESLVLPYRTCLVSGRKSSCPVRADASVAIPWDNVLDARRRSAPVPVWGALALTVGLAFIAAGAVAASPAMRGISMGWRAAYAAPAFVLGGTLVGSGAWHLTARTREELVLPPARP